MNGLKVDVQPDGRIRVALTTTATIPARRLVQMRADKERRIARLEASLAAETAALKEIVAALEAVETLKSDAATDLPAEAGAAEK